MKKAVLLLAIMFGQTTAQVSEACRTCFHIARIMEHCTKAPSAGINCESAGTYIVGAVLKAGVDSKFAKILGNMCSAYCSRPEAYDPDEFFTSCVERLTDRSAQQENSE